LDDIRNPNQNCKIEKAIHMPAWKIRRSGLDTAVKSTLRRVGFITKRALAHRKMHRPAVEITSLIAHLAEKWSSSSLQNWLNQLSTVIAKQSLQYKLSRENLVGTFLAEVDFDGSHPGKDCNPGWKENVLCL